MTGVFFLILEKTQYAVRGRLYLIPLVKNPYTHLMVSRVSRCVGIPLAQEVGDSITDLFNSWDPR